MSTAKPFYIGNLVFHPRSPLKGYLLYTSIGFALAVGGFMSHQMLLGVSRPRAALVLPTPIGLSCQRDGNPED
jgi:hypothetical protein